MTDTEVLYIIKTTGRAAAGKGVMVTSSWDVAAANIKAKLKTGPVRVECTRPRPAFLTKFGG